MVDLTATDIQALAKQAEEWISKKGRKDIETVLDKVNQIASGETFHFSQFALMGEINDLIPPETEILISGDAGEDNW